MDIHRTIGEAFYVKQITCRHAFPWFDRKRFFPRGVIADVKLTRDRRVRTDLYQLP